MKKLITFIVLAFTLFACKKEEPVSLKSVSIQEAPKTWEKSFCITGDCANCSKYKSYYYRSEADLKADNPFAIDTIGRQYKSITIQAPTTIWYKVTGVYSDYLKYNNRVSTGSAVLDTTKGSLTKIIWLYD